MQQFSPSQSNTIATAAETDDLKRDSLSSTLSKPLWVTREHYMAAELWLTRGGTQSTGSKREGGDGETFDRNQKLKEVCACTCMVHTEGSVLTDSDNLLTLLSCSYYFMYIHCTYMYVGIL